jgi:DNA-binding XRE family transcriptional regulator
LRSAVLHCRRDQGQPPVSSTRDLSTSQIEPVIPFGGTRNEITPDFRLVQAEFKTLREQFGRRLRQIRDESGETQEKFAEMIGMSVDFLSLIERGRNVPSFKKLARMASGLKQPVSFFFDFDSLPTPEKKSRRAPHLGKRG